MPDGLENKTVADIGCGGGILAESMAAKGAIVTAIDASEEALQIARLHQTETESSVDYVHSTAEALAQSHNGQFDVVTLHGTPRTRSITGKRDRSLCQSDQTRWHRFFSRR